MRYVVPTRRLGVDAMFKAEGFSRGPKAGHKYLKRVPYFANGKRKWRYYYQDEAQRATALRAGTHNEHDEHLLESDLRKEFDHLRKQIPSVIETTVEYLRDLFGFKKAPKVEIRPGFNMTMHEPYVRAEEAGGEPNPEAPLIRTRKAIEMLPDYIREFVDPGGEDAKGGLRTFRLTTFEEDVAAKNKPEYLGWARPDGELSIRKGSFRTPVGEASYMSDRTLAEEVIWHEFGHHVHFEIERRAKAGDDYYKKIWQEWTSGLPGERITRYAHENAHEDFAETFGCAISHPKQLARQSPERYDWMREHVLTHLPSREDIAKIPDADLAWWENETRTVPGRALMLDRIENPAPNFSTYYSERDQFFTVSQGGRTIYLRVGPANKEEEDEWTDIPATTTTHDIDGEKIDAPKFENLLGVRFKKTGSLKEIYDEHGNALTDHQAFLYLGQNDEKVLRSVGDDAEEYRAARARGEFRVDKPDEEDDAEEGAEGTAGEGSDEAETESAEKPGKDKGGKKAQEDMHLLSYKMFTALGFNKAHTVEAEERRIRRVRAKQRAFDELLAKPEEKRTKRDQEILARGRPTLGLYRHRWVPHEIPAHEYMRKSGTFKFNEIQAAKDQRWIEYDPETKAPVRRADGSLALTARVYEQENPDGTMTRVLVNESAPFKYGDEVRLPNPDTGALETVVLKKGDPLDPFQMARDRNTTAARILKDNHRFDRFQITDPIVAQLINPFNRPVTDATVLKQLMQDAAQLPGVDMNGKPYIGRRAWVTDANNDIDSAVVHMQLHWDGKGAPAVVGGYWARRHGKKDGLRLDEMLTRQDKLKIPKIRERKAQKVPVKVGGVVWIVDPKTGKRVLATLAEIRRDAAGNVKGYGVQPHAGQGSGVARTLVQVERVEAISEDTIVSNPTLRRRLVEPLENDLLLYTDEVPRDAAPTDLSRGVIRIALPKDGSVTKEFIGTLPGITITGGGETGEPVEITLAPHALPKFRERLGGFVMDRGVLQKLDDLGERARMLQEQAGKKNVISAEELGDENGHINPDGLLKGLVSGPSGISVLGHHTRALQKLARNGGRLYAAHFMGTGKTALGIMASQLMRNMKDPEDPTKPHPKAVRKKTLAVVPLNTAQNWFSEFTRFKAPPTLIGSGSLAGAQQIPKLPKRGENEADADFKERVITAWKAAIEKNPKIWNPWADANTDAVVPYEYFRDNEEALRMIDVFDGMIVDEAHKIARENEVSKAIERWNPKMNLFLLLSGTPITNTIDTIPRIIEMTTAGQVSLGTKEEFRDRFMVESAVLRAVNPNAKEVKKTDLNPQTVGELVGVVQPYMDVATTADVKGKAMPAVLLDENNPAAMVGQQARMYRAAEAALTEEDREKLAASAALGMDEKHLLSEEARRKVAVARCIANAPSYKAPDAREEMTYEATVVVLDKRGNPETKTQTRTFELPSLSTLLDKPPRGWGGRWPSTSDVVDGRVDAGYHAALMLYMDRILGVGYEVLEGKPIAETKQGAALLESLRKNGEFTTVTGERWLKGTGTSGGGRLKNPDYGPEGMACRGVYDDLTGEITSIRGEWYNPETEQMEPIEVPVGQRFVRDPRSKASGLYYAAEDWDYTGRFSMAGEGGESEDEDDEETKKKREKIPDLTEATRAEMDKAAKKFKINLAPELDDDDFRVYLAEQIERSVLGEGEKGTQKPKEGREGWTIQRHPARRKERAMFDIAVTHNNAKCDRLEELMKNTFKEKTGSGADAQMIIFGRLIGSAVRTPESKLRTMGYMDVNEALGNPAWSSDADKKRAQITRKFFVTYMGASATLGERDINSEIFRRQQTELGKDTGISMFVWRSLYGDTSKAPPKAGEVREPWSRDQRRKIAQSFVDGTGKLKKDGTPAGMEVPMRVMGKVLADGSLGQVYAYESDIKAGVLRQIKSLELDARTQRGEDLKRTNAKIAELLEPYWTERKPLTDHQIDVMNNTQVMVASDAANVGLNWPAQQLVMYDSLFSPMEEWQRITRAARMLPAAIEGPAKDLVHKVGAYIDAAEKAANFKEYEGVDSAMLIVREAMENALTPDERAQLVNLPGGAPDQVLESWFSQRAFDRIAAKREEVGAQLRRLGVISDPTRPEASYIPPEAIQDSDVMNEIIRNHLTPFDREVLKSRRYLVDVKRLTVSVEMPEMKRVKVRLPNGKTKTTVVHTGEWVTESPARAERAQLAQGRSKMVPYEYAMNALQNAQPKFSSYDTTPAWSGSHAVFSSLPENDQTLNTPGGATIKKALRFVVPRRVLS